MTRTRWAGLVLAVAAVLIGVLWSTRGPAATTVDVGAVTRRATFESTVSASGEIVAARSTEIGTNAFGRIVKLNVAEGDTVRKGQVLAEIDSVQASSELAAAAAQVQALQADARAALQQIQAAQSDRDAAAARAQDAARTLDRTADLFRRGLATASARDQAQAAADAARAQLQSAEAAVKRSEQLLASATRQIAQAVAQQRRAADVVSKTSVIAPMSGVVTSLPVQEGEMAVVGIQNMPGTTLMTISDLSSINAEVKVAEADVLQVKNGQSASVTLDAVPGRTFTGRVIEVGASALPTTGAGTAAREFRVVIRLDHSTPGLKPGMTCDAEILTRTVQNALTVPLQSVVLRPTSQGRDEPGVFIVKAGKARFVPVKTGIIGGLDMDVQGVEDGAPVIIGPYQVLATLTDGAAVRASSGSGG